MMMKKHVLLALPLLLLPLSAAFAGDNALFRHSDSCLHVPPGDARTECMKKQREAAAAFEMERKREEATTRSADHEPSKKEDPCFTRKATGERVCPN
jgi:hypothetical protein